jgi:hypothetical protein
VQTWQALLGDQDVIASRFDVYDEDGSGELDASQVTHVLKDLNGGTAPTADDVKWVIDSTDGRVVRDVLNVSIAQDAARNLDVCFTLSASGLVHTGSTSQWLTHEGGAESGSCRLVHAGGRKEILRVHNIVGSSVFTILLCSVGLLTRPSWDKKCIPFVHTVLNRVTDVRFQFDTVPSILCSFARTALHTLRCPSC